MSTAAAGLLGISLVAVTPTAASAALPPPPGLNVSRPAGNVHQVVTTWKPVAGADHYVVDILAGDVRTIVNRPASVTSYTVDAPNPCTAYKVTVGAADAAGNVTKTGVYSLRPLGPGGTSGLAPTRNEDGTVAYASWRPPAWLGYTPLTGYRVVFTRMADGVVLYDQTSTETSFTYRDVAPSRAYTLAVSPVNDFGSCVTAKSLLDRVRPGDPTGLVVKRKADTPGTVEVSWKAPASGPATTYYQIAYKSATVSKLTQVDAATTATTLALDVKQAWTVEVKAYNSNGGSNAAVGSVPVWGTPPSDTVTANPATSLDSSTVSTGPDRVAPTITATLSQKAAGGWFRTPTTIHFTCADNSGSVASCPDDIVAATDGVSQRYSGTARDGAGNTTTMTLVMKIDQAAPGITGVANGTKNAAGWYSAPPTISYTCSDAISGIATCPAPTVVQNDGTDQQITGTAYDKAGNSASAPVTVSVDQTAPRIVASVVGTPNAGGWYHAAPTIHFTCTDSGSGIAECPADRTLTTDGANQSVTGTATDKAGNTATTSITVNLDRTTPTITAAAVGTPKAGGWYSTPLVVHFTCTDTDTGAGIADCPADRTITTDGAAQSISGSVTDKAGNTATTSISLNVDGTAPTVTASVIGTPNGNGWYVAAPTVHFTCADSGSGVAVCPADQTVSWEGANQTVIGTATDNAGNTATANVSVSVDRYVPTITASVAGAPNANGWYRTAPTVHFTCADSGSGVAACPADRTVTADGAGQAVVGTVADKAGNTASANVSVSVDRTAPAITATVNRAPNGNGWFATAPVVHFTCTDAGSGVADCPADRTVGTDGANQTVTGTATDRAGNTATATVSISMDGTAPTVTATVIGTANANGWYSTAPTVHFTCSDAGSGIADCPADRTVGSDGAAQPVAGTATDKAGNSTSAGLSVSVDRTAPTITASVSQPPNAKGWYTTAPVIHFTCTDAGSGVADCPADRTVTTDGLAQSITGATTDRAGNSTLATAKVNVDRTVPSVKIVGAADGTIYGPDQAPVVSCQTTDATSGVATPAVLKTEVSGIKYTVSCTGGTDKAGNAAPAVQLSYKVGPTIPWLIALEHSYMPKASAATLQQLDKEANGRQWAAYIAHIGNEARGKSATISAVNAATLCFWALVIQAQG